MTSPIERLERRRMLADVLGLTLIDANTDQPVGGFDLVDGAVIDLATLGRELNIRGEVTADTGSVRFNYDGDPTYALDSNGPYALGGNTGNDYHAWTPTLGTHALVVTAYPGVDGLGERGVSQEIVFRVVDSAPPASTVIRVNAGGGSFTTSGGVAFAADVPGAGFTGGTQEFSAFPVAGTLDDPLYQSRRFGKRFTFARPADNGRYTLTLHFAEPTFKKPGQRVFDVSAEGALLLDDLDLVTSAGTKTALVKTFPVTVADGQINLTFDASHNHAIVSAIELAPVPPVFAPPAPVRIDAGGGRAITDSLGRVFEDDDAYITGGTDVIGPAMNYFNSDDDTMLGSYREGAAFSFARPIANGRYSLWLEFADPASHAAGERSFDVSVEGQLVLDDFDVFAAADAARVLRGTYGAIDVTNVKMAVARKFDVNVTDNRLDLDFTGVVGNAIVSAIVLVPTEIPTALIPYSGLADYPSSPQREAVRVAWSVRSQSNLRRIGFGMLLFANEHKGKLPPDFAAMLEGRYVDRDDLSIFANPRLATLPPRGVLSLVEDQAWVAKQTDYLLAPAWAGQRVQLIPRGEAGTTIFIYENPDTTPYDDLNVFYADGHVGVLPRATLIAQFGGATDAPPEPARPVQTAVDANVAASQQKLRTLAQALLTYSNNNRGRYPIELGLLFPSYIGDADTFRNPRTTTPPPPAGMTQEQARAWINAQSDYRYLAAGRTRRTPVIAYENPAEMAIGINILFEDGRVELREMGWALETIAAAKAWMASPS